MSKILLVAVIDVGQAGNNSTDAYTHHHTTWAHIRVGLPMDEVLSVIKS